MNNLRKISGNINWEKWKDIIGYDGLYKVSNLGRIKSFHSGKVIIRKQYLNKSGYLMVGLRKDGIKVIKGTHIYVAIAFLKHVPNGRSIVVDHIFGNKSDNRAKRLQVVTHIENITICFKKPKDGFTSKYRGVYFQKQGNSWRADIRRKGVTKHLGYFKTEIEASDAYEKAKSLYSL